LPDGTGDDVLGCVREAITSALVSASKKAPPDCPAGFLLTGVDPVSEDKP
jgi:hypothetical protein